MVMRSNIDRLEDLPWLGRADTAVFVSRKTAAARLEISLDTFDQWVKDKFLPAPTISHGSIRRWHWPTVEERLAGASDGDEEGQQYLTGVQRA